MCSFHIQTPTPVLHEETRNTRAVEERVCDGEKEGGRNGMFVPRHTHKQLSNPRAAHGWISSLLTTSILLAKGCRAHLLWSLWPLTATLATVQGARPGTSLLSGVLSSEHQRDPFLLLGELTLPLCGPILTKQSATGSMDIPSSGPGGTKSCLGGS